VETRETTNATVRNESSDRIDLASCKLASLDGGGEVFEVFAMCSTCSDFRECLTSLNKTGECIGSILAQAENTVGIVLNNRYQVVCCYI